ncbi:hypothetical protein X534_gp02 [Ralstonia phage RSB3]|uniref:Uncharacterized protein n=1 Tax=Ralstonia phage RSB3 TaxID=1402875 RepID=U3TK57_9CAUD|nr:hypothetical protein X534_gp02 [Ralstonia phage RSB3]BAN92313.1 hypothetical protein [Ralstonia phage RSB3]
MNLHQAIYTEVEPATNQHGTQVVARLGHMVVTVPYPYEFTEWEDIHGAAVLALLQRKAKVNPDTTKYAYIPALFGAGMVWVCNETIGREFTV